MQEERENNILLTLKREVSSRRKNVFSCSIHPPLDTKLSNGGILEQSYNKKISTQGMLSDDSEIKTTPGVLSDDSPGVKKEKDKTNKGVIIGIIIIIIILLGLILSIIFVRRRVIFQGRARGPSQGQVILANSYMFASPLKAVANGKEKIRITVFLLDETGRGVIGKPVSLGDREKLVVNPIQPISDEVGRAVFDLASNTPGVYILEASVEGKVIPQRINISFY